MAVRIGIIGRKSIIAVIREEIELPWARNFVLILIFGAIMIGNTAYEAGNISGAALGLETLIGSFSFEKFGFKSQALPYPYRSYRCNITLDREI